jgi:hypothetical protein
MQQRNVARELGLAVASVAVLVHWLDAKPAFLVTVLIAAAAAAGTGPLVGEWRPWRMPLVPMVLPALAAFAIAGISRVVDPVPWLAFVFLAGWVIVAWVVTLETASEAITPLSGPPPEPLSVLAATVATEPPTMRLRPKRRAEYDIPLIVSEPVFVNTPELPPHPRPVAIRIAAMGLAFLGFIAAGALVPGGLALDREPLSRMHMAELALLNGAIAGVVGYRIASLSSPHRFDRIVRVVAIGQYALPIALLTIVFRSWAFPRLFIPALLTATAYILTSVRESSEPVPQNVRLLQELAVIGVAAFGVIAWGVLTQ